jgi:hypothetical protein
MRDLEQDDLQKDQYQDFGGYRLPVPGSTSISSKGDDIGFQPRPDPTGDISDRPRPSIASSSPGGGMAETRSLAPPAPSISEVMGGGASPVTPAAPAASPAPSASIDHDQILKQIMGGTGTQAPPPTSTDNLSSLIQKRATAGQPLDPHDPKYRMGTGMRILQSVGNFASGFGGDKRPPTYVGPGATNSRFDIDSETQAKNLGNLDKQIGSTEKLNDETQKAYATALKQSYETKLNDTREETAQARQTAAQAQKDKADTAQQLADAKNAGIDYNPKTRRFTKDGKVYVPKTMEEGATLEGAFGVNDGFYTKNWKSERKNQPLPDHSASDAAKAIQVAEYRQRQHADLDKQVESERNKRYAELDKDVTIKYDPNKMAAAKAKIDTDLESKYKPKHDSIDSDADGMLGMTKSGGPLKKNVGKNAPAAPPSAAPVAPKASPAAAPAAATYKYSARSKDGSQSIGSNDGKTWFDKKTGKPFTAAN